MRGLRNINIFDINFILCFCGFTIFTTFVNSDYGSIIYRAVALIIALICIAKSGIQFRHNNLLILFVSIFSLLLLKVSCNYIANLVPPIFEKSAENVLLYGYGITFIPMLSVIGSWDKIHQKTCMSIIFISLLIILAIGWHESTTTLNTERFNLNNRQSALAYGDNGAYLVLLSFAMLSRFKQFKFKPIFLILLIIGTFVGFISISKAASRGALAGCIIAFIFIAFNSTKIIRKAALIIIVLSISSGVIILKYLEKASPILYSRVMLTITERDMSGREFIFEDGLKEIEENPIFGSNPIILEYNGNFTSYHNCYLDVAVGLGIIGGVAFLYLIMNLAWKSIYYRKNLTSSWDLFIMGMLWFFIVRSMVGVSLFSNSTYDICVSLSTIILHSYGNRKTCLLRN